MAGLAARAWPTLVVVDPEGYIVAHLSGEGHAGGLDRWWRNWWPSTKRRARCTAATAPTSPAETTAGDLRFPGKVIPLPDGVGSEGGSFLVTDTGHHRLVELAPTCPRCSRPTAPVTRAGRTGAAGEAKFNEPQGLALCRTRSAAEAGYDVVIADSVNHRLRGLSLATGQVTTVAGNGIQRLLDADTQRTGPGDGTSGSRLGRRRSFFRRGAGRGTGRSHRFELGAARCRSAGRLAQFALDVHWSTRLNAVVIAMAGVHQIFTLDPVSGKVAILAGTGLEGLQDGDATAAWFAQSSGLAGDAAGNIWVADSETSALRKISFVDVNGENRVQVSTAIGAGLFDFGFRDGAAAEARLQHPLGVAVLPDGSVAVADTYNGAVRRYDPATETVSTLARGLAEPSDVLLDTTAVADGGEPLLLVVEANKHQLIRLPIPKEALTVDEGASQTQRPKTEGRPARWR